MHAYLLQGKYDLQHGDAWYLRIVYAWIHKVEKKPLLENKQSLKVVKRKCSEIAIPNERYHWKIRQLSCIHRPRK